MNTGALIVAPILFVYGITAASPPILWQSASNMLAAVGVSIAVAPNQYNTIAEQLSEKEKQLAQRESAIASKESSTAALGSQSTLFALLSIGLSVVLFVLVGINFYLDARARRRMRTSSKLSIDLR